MLPTGGTARHTAGCPCCRSFAMINVVECSHGRLAATLPQFAALGGAEDLPAHVTAVQARFGDAGPGGTAGG